MPIYCIQAKSTELIGLVFSFNKIFAIAIRFCNLPEKSGTVRRQKNSMIFDMCHLGTNTQLLRLQAI
jgi:hypothetical protein